MNIKTKSDAHLSLHRRKDSKKHHLILVQVMKSYIDLMTMTNMRMKNLKARANII
jgi:hypothetical protein